MEEKEIKPSFINSASLGGLYMGACLSAGIVLSYLFQNAAGLIGNIFILIAFIGVAYYIGKKFVAEHKEELVGFGRTLGFILTMIAFAGVVYGVTNFIMLSYVDPEYYLEQYKAGAEAMALDDKLPSGLIEDSFELQMKSPISTIFASVFSMFIMGIFPALIIASLIKTKR